MTNEKFISTADEMMCYQNIINDIAFTREQTMSNAKTLVLCGKKIPNRVKRALRLITLAHEQIIEFARETNARLRDEWARK